MSEQELRATRKSDTIFVFGSGASLNAITPDEWSRIARHDTMGFNWFVHQRFVRCDYHLVREIGGSDMDEAHWKPYLYEYFERLGSNPMFAHSVLLVQTGLRATASNRAIWLELISREQRIFRWRSIRNAARPSSSLRSGLAHSAGTLCECVNFAVLMGWTRIVLVGVDLYDRRYFWLPPDVPRPEETDLDATHATALGGIVTTLDSWSEQLAPRGIRLYVHNPRSLLSQVLPVWQSVNG
jgi:hypothetical protein